MDETSSEEGSSRASLLYSDGDEAPPASEDLPNAECESFCLDEAPPPRCTEQQLVPNTVNYGCDSCSFDAVVVGSGYGGAVAACRLAEAGLRVCLLERGRRFEPHHFPRSLPKLLLNTAFHTPYKSIGRRNALYQIHLQPDSLAVVASGLGGGSLINAGVLLPTPKRARSDPRWPIEWEDNWDLNESKARAMLDSQSIPFEFPSSKVMDAISGEIEDCVKDKVHLSVRMKAGLNTFGVPQKDCRACGNCLTGCPYDAKSSTDKNYIASALQAGMHVYTECEVQYVLRNCTSGGNKQVITCQPKRKERRRWRVYLNDVDFLLADFVVLSGNISKAHCDG